MTGPAGFLEFFILEASDYVEQLDGLLLHGGSEGPDAARIQRVARALRGTATMAKLPSFADLAAAVERIGRALHEGAVRWDPSLGGALVATVDDFKILLHKTRGWSPAEDQRAATRAAELARFAPAPSAAAAMPDTAPGRANDTSPFLATESANIAAGLELLVARPTDSGMISNVLRRIRALRGVAGVKEIGPLADTLEASEDAARGIENGQSLTPEGKRLLATGAEYLRVLGTLLRAGADVESPSSARDNFMAAQERWSERIGERERVVPIADLFYEDGQPGVVEASANPPTSAPQRFRIELVSLGEHLRQVVENASGIRDSTSTARARRDLRRALGAMQSAAESFGERDIAAFIASHLYATDHVDFLGLTALGDLAALVSEPGAHGERLTTRLAELTEGRAFAQSISVGFGSEVPPQQAGGPRNLIDVMSEAAMERGIASAAQDSGTRRPFIVDTPVFSASIPFAPLSAPQPAGPPDAPRATEISVAAERAGDANTPVAVPVEKLDWTAAALIDSGIAALEALSANPFADLVSITDELIVPIETLLYRGRAALDRAVEVRDELRRTAPSVDRAALEELFDLVEMARAE